MTAAKAREGVKMQLGRTSGSHRLRAAGLALLICLTSAPALGLEAGDVAPAFRAPRLDGTGTLSLEELRGKVVFVDFWASWCAPCQKSMPQLDALRKEFPADRFALIGVNVDKDTAAAKKLLGKRPVGYPSASDPEGGLPERFGLETMPTAYLIDADGVIRYVHRGFRDGDIEAVREKIGALLAGQE
jgi:thiol-disulfide isomerase/thioredoxin